MEDIGEINPILLFQDRYMQFKNDQMILQEYIGSLSKEKQFDIAIRLTRAALQVWEIYFDNNNLSFRDTFVGLNHPVDRKLLKNIINVVEKFVSTNKIKRIFIKTLTFYHHPNS